MKCTDTLCEAAAVELESDNESSKLVMIHLCASVDTCVFWGVELTESVVLDVLYCVPGQL